MPANSGKKVRADHYLLMAGYRSGMCMPLPLRSSRTTLYHEESVGERSLQMVCCAKMHSCQLPGDMSYNYDRMRAERLGGCQGLCKITLSREELSILCTCSYLPTGEPRLSVSLHAV